MTKKKPGNIFRNWREWEKQLLAQAAEIKRALLRPRQVKAKKANREAVGSRRVVEGVLRQQGLEWEE